MAERFKPIPDVHFGKVTDAEELPDLDDDEILEDDDEEEFDPEIIKLLGFDPREEDEEEAEDDNPAGDGPAGAPKPPITRLRPTSPLPEKPPRTRPPVAGTSDEEPYQIGDHDMIPKAEVEYEHPAKGSEHCGDCLYFRQPKACALIEPPIQPEDWCQLFEDRDEALGEDQLADDFKGHPRDHRGRFVGKGPSFDELDPDLKAVADQQPHLMKLLAKIHRNRRTKDEVPPSESPELNEINDQVPLDPDLLQIAEGKPQNIVQYIYRIQAERDQDRQPLIDDAEFKETAHPRGGDPKNTGRFSKGQGGKKAAAKPAEGEKETEAKPGRQIRKTYQEHLQKGHEIAGKHGYEPLRAPDDNAKMGDPDNPWTIYQKTLPNGKQGTLRFYTGHDWQSGGPEGKEVAVAGTPFWHHDTEGQLDGIGQNHEGLEDHLYDLIGKHEPEHSASSLLREQRDPEMTLEKFEESLSPEVKKKLKQIADKLEVSTPTDALPSQGGFKNADGTYTPEREKLHESIIDKILTPEVLKRCKPPEGQKPTYTMIGGRGGSGKSWFTQGEGAPVDGAHSLVLDSDAIKGMLPEYKGWNAALVHEESGDIFAAITDLAREEGLNIVHDATMRSTSSLRPFLNQFKQSEYNVEGYYMFLPPEKAAERAVGRFLNDSDLTEEQKAAGWTGRYVPPKYVLDSTSNERSFDDLRRHFSKWAIYDNNVERGRPPKYVASSEGHQ